ncbi:hypothetical protein K493DRAFT_297287 [Basidiobolus meristosporus CBS 931.73]|uniref:PPPDE domain-containing protein n=1 Tax=Basidiobolus meristosporus CBS 931.73 TaxID=1314790 RepID=A0A1Y1Z0I0_9FUNG|nr:hypothetical protein K493DRAFT_297287 [Basidiobolus meristosporus CBS 931.73]|eukprot:ORY03788.1 hypothetical protein K493DRAFT_297287 [Basidiobolus meristosporus CBS 931.73]
MSEKGTTHHGEPLRVLDMGSTEVPKELFLEYIEQLKNVYTADKYHLLDNNCNTFTNEVCQFLTGKTIPDYITGKLVVLGSQEDSPLTPYALSGLPQDFLNTPLGQQLRPLIDGFFRPGSQSAFIPSVSTADDQNRQAQQVATEETHAGLLTYPDTVRAADAFVKDHHASVLYFGQAESPECQHLEPEFIHLIGQYSKIPGKTIHVAKIDVKRHTDIAYVYSARSCPLIKFYLKGEKINEITQPTAALLDNALKALYRLAYPAHDHLTLSTSTLEALSISPIQWPERESLAELKKLAGEMIPSWTPRDDASLTTLKLLEGDEKADQQEVAQTIDEPAVKLIDASLAKNSVALEVLSEVALQSDGVKEILAHAEQLYAIFEKDRWTDEHAFVRKSVLHLACSLLSSIQGARAILTKMEPRRLVTELLVDCLLVEEEEIRKAASFVLYNIAVWIGQDRRQTFELIDLPEGVAFSNEDTESWLVELVSAAVSAVEMTTTAQDAGLAQNLITSLAHLLFLGDATVISLASILGLSTSLEQIAHQTADAPSAPLIQEISSLLQHGEDLEE